MDRMAVICVVVAIISFCACATLSRIYDDSRIDKREQVIQGQQELIELMEKKIAAYEALLSQLQQKVDTR